MKEYIFEMPIYDGRMKEWRVLNLSTNTFYSVSYETPEEAAQSIEHETERAGKTVIRIKWYHDIFDYTGIACSC